MRVSFRLKLAAIVGVATLAFALVAIGGSIIAGRVEARLATIQGLYLPKLEVGPNLDRSLERLRRSFGDAVVARDPEALAATADEKRAFLRQVTDAGDALTPADAAALRAALEDYYAAVYDVSRRRIANETGEDLVNAIAAMRAKLDRVREALRSGAELDRKDLENAFAAANGAVRLGHELNLSVSIACMVLMFVLSAWIGGQVLRSVAELRSGFRRFGEGSFAEPIRVLNHDEIGDVAGQANLMAANLARLGEESRKAEAALKLSNQELEAFSYAVAHDLRAPLRGINGFSQALLEDYSDALAPEAKEHLNRIAAGAERMGQLIDALLALSRVTRVELRREAVNLSQLADAAMKQLRTTQPDRAVDFVLQAQIVGYGDAPLLRASLENLLANAWKFTTARAGARIEFGAEQGEGGPVYYVKDNGAGFDMAYADKLFAPFQRLHSARDFAGTGIGLATVQRIVHRHGGRIWAEASVDRGATFRFTLAPRASRAHLTSRPEEET